MSGTTPWGTTVTVQVSSAAPDADPPVWVDMSDYITFRGGDLTIDSGQQTDLAESPEPATAQLAWRNDDHRFSDPNGPYPWFKEARRVQVLEVVDGQTFYLFDGYLGPPQHVPMVDTADASMSILTTVSTATDRLARLRNAGAFISTLTEYIRFAGGSRLAYYWPLLESSGSTFTSIVGTSAPLTPRYGSVVGMPITSPKTGGFITAGGAPTLFADDRPGLAFQTDGGDLAGVLAPARWAFIAGYPSVTCTNNTITLVFWYYADVSRQPTLAEASPCDINNFNTAGAGHQADIEYSADPTGTSWTADFAVDTSFVTFTAPSPRTNAWNLISLSMTLPSGSCTAYVHNFPAVSGVMSGTPPSTVTFTEMLVGLEMNGAVAHAQIWVGPYTQADHDAQLLAAQTGLERQQTGQRVNTILDYAGVSSARRDVQGGVALMQVASLAGKDPLTCLEEARRTERGRLFMSGDGKVTFQDRDTVYNVA